MTAEAAGPRSGFVEAALGPWGWREPMVWLVVVGWVAYVVWVIVVVAPASSRYDPWGVWALLAASWVFEGWGKKAWPDEAGVDTLPSLGLMLAIIGAPLLLAAALFVWADPDGLLVRSTLAAIVLFWSIWRQWSEVQRRRSRPLVQRPSLADSGWYRRVRRRSV